MGRAFLMVVVSIQPHAEFGSNDHLEDAPHFIKKMNMERPKPRSIQFVDWCPTGFKVGINYEAPTVVPGNYHNMLTGTHST